LTSIALSAGGAGVSGVFGVAASVASPTDGATILKANPMIKAQMGHDPTIFAIGELGGGYSGTAGTQTVTSYVEESINMAKLSASGNFVIGFYNGSAVDPSDVSVLIQVRDNAGYLLNQTYNGNEAMSLFSGTAPTLPNTAFTNSGTEGVTITMTVTTMVAGAGFSGDFILGDPPDTQTVEKSGITDRAYTSVTQFYTEGVLTSVAEYTSPGHLLQDVAISHNVSAFGLTGLQEGVHTQIADSPGTESDIYRDASGHVQAVVTHLANGGLGITAEVGGLTFDFGPSSGVEAIRGYVAGADTFDISHTMFSSFTEMMSHAEQAGHNVVINYGVSDVLTLTDTSLSELNAHMGDFHFI
jgi:hypothetical protein